MKPGLLKIFKTIISVGGHKSASDLTSIETKQFEIFATCHFTNEENYSKLTKIEEEKKLFPAYILYNNNKEFVQQFKLFLGDRIIEEIEFVSDLFNNKLIKLLIIKVKEDDIRFVYEMNSADRLTFF